MKTTADRSIFQEEDHVPLKSRGEMGRSNATVGVVSGRMDTTNESRGSTTSRDGETAIALVATEGTTDHHGSIPYSAQQSERWLLERTYHAQLCDGRELSVADLTLAMKQLTDFDVPLSTWREISPEEAQALFHQGSPILLYREHTWEHQKGAFEPWRPNSNMRALIYGNASTQPETVSGTEYAVCYLDPKQGTFSNTAWKAWFSSDPITLLDGNTHSPIISLGPCVQFPYSTHYTVIASDGHVHEYADRAEAIQGFHTFSPREKSDGYTAFPQFCYYHEIACPGGVYRLEFFGPHMGEQGYYVKEGEERERASTREASK